VAPYARLEPSSHAKSWLPWLGDYAHGQALRLGQNVTPKIHAIERSVIAPRNRCFALLRSRGCSARFTLSTWNDGRGYNLLDPTLFIEEAIKRGAT
jgi:hypothetical protein